MGLLQPHDRHRRRDGEIFIELVKYAPKLIAAFGVLPTFLLGACASIGAWEGPCHDGWTRGSKVIELDQKALASLRAALGDDRVLSCVHQRASGELLAVYYKPGGLFREPEPNTREFELIDGAVILDEDVGIIIGARQTVGGRIAKFQNA